MIKPPRSLQPKCTFLILITFTGLYMLIYDGLPLFRFFLTGCFKFEFSLVSYYDHCETCWVTIFSCLNSALEVIKIQNTSWNLIQICLIILQFLVLNRHKSLLPAHHQLRRLFIKIALKLIQPEIRWQLPLFLKSLRMSKLHGRHIFIQLLSLMILKPEQIFLIIFLHFHKVFKVSLDIILIININQYLLSISFFHFAILKSILFLHLLI